MNLMGSCGTRSAYTKGCRCEPCRGAQAAYQRGYYERKAAIDPAYRHGRTFEQMRRAHLRRAYGISLEYWEALFERQGRRCAICLSDSSKSTKSWHTDHDHKTGKVRGILCIACNRSLGCFGDDEAGLLRALAYLRGEPDDED